MQGQLRPAMANEAGAHVVKREGQAMRRILLGALLGCCVMLVLAGAANAQPAPTFKLGFKALADQIPDVVGIPLENEHWAANGDSLQTTSKGMMVWRKADNWTAFTNGSRTWISGPAGLQERDNNDRFEWELLPPKPPNPLPPVDEYAYMRWVVDNLQTAGGVLERVNSAFSRAGGFSAWYNDPGLKTEMTASLAGLKDIGQKLQGYQSVPENCKALNDGIVALGGDLVYIADELTAAINTMDLHRAQNAMDRLYALPARMGDLNKALEEWAARYRTSVSPGPPAQVLARS